MPIVVIGKTDPQYRLPKKTVWPSFRDTHCFWTDAALHIRVSTCANILLTSKFNVNIPYNSMCYYIIFQAEGYILYMDKIV